MYCSYNPNRYNIFSHLHVSFKEEYLRNKIKSWKNQLEILSKIAEIQPQAAYSAFGFKHKLTFFAQVAPNIADYLLLIEETFIGHMLDMERALLALPLKLDGLGLQTLCEVGSIELLITKLARK